MSLLLHTTKMYISCQSYNKSVGLSVVYPRSSGQPVELRALVTEKFFRRPGLGDSALVQEDDPVPPGDGVEPVGDGEDGAVPEAGADRLLDQSVGPEIEAIVLSTF